MEQENQIEQLVKSLEKKKRPAAITVVCIIGFVGMAVTILVLFSGLASRVGSWYALYLTVSALIGFVSMVGLWQMKKWGAYGYTAFMLVNQVAMLSMGTWTLMTLIVPAAVIATAFSYVKKME